MLKKILIERTTISKKSMPYIVAEVSGNHNQSLYRALKMIELAKKAGASAVKIQAYTPESMTLNLNKKDFIIKDKNSPWHGKTLYDLYVEASTPINWIKKIFDYSRKIGITCFSSIFDTKILDILEKLNAPAYKISSFELGHIPLIKKVALTKKPIILSTGMASDKEIQESVDIIKKINNKLILLHCSSEYPANLKNCNLERIPYMAKKFNCLTGYSDHTVDLVAPIVAVAKEAVLIEKHFKFNEKIKSVDSKFSLSPNEFSKMVLECNKAKKSLGNVFFNISRAEKFNKKFTRSIYISKNVLAGDVLSNTNLNIIRSNKGMHPRNFSSVLGKKFKKTYKTGTPLSLSMIKR